MRIPIAALAVLSFLFAPPVTACGTAEVCSDVAASFTGGVEAEIVALDWETDSESAALWQYRLYRGTTLVSTQDRTGVCNVTEGYGYEDAYGSHGTWYTLEVWGWGARACAIDFQIP